MQPRREDRGHAPRVAAPTHKNDEKGGGGTGPSGSFAADATRVGGSGPAAAMAPPAAAAPPNPSASDPASVAAALRDYERRLGEKEAHLKMLRSRLEMAERDGETARRRLEAGRLERERERERERNAAAGGFGHIQNDVRGSNPKPYSLDADTLNGTLNGTNGTNGRGFGSRSNAIRAGGPAPMEVSNAAALQEARAELARLRARVAFKDEEAEEARRREDEQRASLRRSEAEAMRLAAEVRKERRRAAAAEGDARARGVNGGENGGEKRSRDVFHGAATNEAEAEAEAARLRSEERVDGSDAGERRSEPETLPPAPPVSLVLPPPPASLASGFSSDRASVFPDGAAAFAATVAAAPTAARAILGFAGPARAARAPSGSRGSDTSSPDDGVALAAFRLRDVLSDLAADAATAASFAAAAADLVVAAAEELKQSRSDEQSADADAFDARVGVRKRSTSGIFPSRASFLRDVARDAMFAAAAAARADASAAATLARLFGVADAAPTYGYLVAPRPPPEPLAGVPAAGTDHVGMLAPYPGARGGFELETRVFAPASALRGSSPEGPEGPSANVFPATAGEVRNGRAIVADFSIGDDRAFGTHTLGTLGGTHKTRGARELTPSLPSSFLSSVSVILSSSLSAGDWFAARAALRLLSRAAAEADPLRARGVFAVTAAAGLLERALGGEGARRGPDGARAAASAAARSADAADAASAPTGGARDADRPSGPDRERDTRAFASSRSSHAEWNASRPRPPARVRRDALALVRLLAATPEFAASLSGAAAPRLAAERDALPRKTSRAGGDAAAKRKNQKDAIDAVSDDVGEALEDGDEPGEEPPDYPLLRAVVACVEEFAEEASFIGELPSSLETSPLETFAVEDELEGVGAYHRVGSGTAADAALLTLAAISHAGWSGWGDAVRRHGVLAAAVVAAEAAFAMADSENAADQRRLRHALMFVARLLAEPASARAASSALRRDGETCRRLARVARAANAHAEQMPRRVGKYLDSVLTAWS